MQTKPPELMLVSDTPPLKFLAEEFERAGGETNCSIGRDRNDRIRFNLWPGRTSDYKKHRDALGEDPIPWEDAWDGRLYTADGIIEFLGCVLKNAFRRANFDMKASSAEAIPRAANAKKVMTKFRDRDKRALQEEADYMWEFGLSYGAAVWQVTWDRQVAMKMQTVTLAQIVEAAQQALEALQQLAVQQAQAQSAIGNPQSAMEGPQSAMEGPQSAIGNPQSAIPPELLKQLAAAATLPTRILDPDQEDALAKSIQESAQQVAAQLFTSQRDEYGDAWLKNYQLSKADARKVVRDLRTKGSATYPAPYLHKNAPCVTAREIGMDYFTPPERTTADSATMHHVREYLTPAAIMENKITDGWDADACDEAVKTAGQSTDWRAMIDIGEIEIDDQTQTCTSIARDSRTGLVEIIYTYARYITPNGIPQLWCTVYCPHAMRETGGARKDLYLRHYPLTDSSSYGFFDYRWQKRKRNFHSNLGIPELVGSDQHSMKRSLDMLVDRQDLELNPPWMVANRLGMRYKAGPGSQIPRKRAGDIEPASPPTGNPELAFKLIESAELRLANYFGLMHPQVAPTLWQTRLQSYASDFLESAEEMFKHYWHLIQQNADAAELSRISGDEEGFPTDPAELEGEFDVTLSFDVKDLDMEFVFKKLQAIGQLAVPLDRAGVIDLGQLTRMILLAIDPTMASALIKDDKGASKAVYNDVAQQVLMMSAGNEADQVENDPTAENKLKYLANIIGGNPKYKAKLGMIQLPNEQPDAHFAALLAKYEKNLQMSVKQQDNKQIGRTGVEPNEQEVPEPAM